MYKHKHREVVIQEIRDSILNSFKIIWPYFWRGEDDSMEGKVKGLQRNALKEIENHQEADRFLS